MAVETATREAVRINADFVELEGNLTIPPGARSLVAFAHGSGSSRHSPRNRFVADVMSDGGLATLLLDLLTEREETVDLQTRELRFDIDLLARRMVGTVDWLRTHAATADLDIGLFGSSTGAAAALAAASQRPERIQAVVSRGGRPDLAGEALSDVAAPALFIVGGMDTRVIELNRQAMARIGSPSRLEIVTGAGHLFEEPGALEKVARLAREWFRQHLGVPAE